MSNGRPKTTNFTELEFQLVKSDKKDMAHCNVCKNILQNTALNRLKAHRKRCENIKNFEPNILNSSSSSTMDIVTYNIEDIEIQKIESTEMDVFISDNNIEGQENYGQGQRYPRHLEIIFKTQTKMKLPLHQPPVYPLYDMAINDYALVGYYLHPFYDNEMLTGDHQGRLNHFLLKNLSGDGIEEWHFYKNRLGLFEVLYNKGIEKPHIFWSTAEIKYPELSKLAIKILNLPASSAQIERIFSNLCQIHTSIRNRLTFERSKRLLHIYFALNNKKNLSEKVQSSDDDNDCD